MEYATEKAFVDKKVTLQLLIGVSILNIELTTSTFNG
jgi:hypothetical protein